MITALAQEGVGVYATPTSARSLRRVSAPAVPIRVLKSQAAAYAAQIADGGGVVGVELDQLMPMPAAPAGTQYPSFAYLLAAYAGGTATPGEALAHRLLTSADLQRPDTVVFPDLVLTLMSADVYRPATRPSTGGVDPTPLGSGSGSGSARIASGSLCSTLSDWVSSGFGALSKALMIGSSSNGALSFIGGLWNSAVSLAQSGLSNVATALTGPVRPGGFAFPSGLTDCAQLLGIQLPSFDRISGRKVDWTFTQVNGTPTTSWCTTASCGLATEDTSTTATQLNSQHQATLHYLTNTETPAQVKAGGLITNDYVLVKGTIKLDTQGLSKLLQDVVLGRELGLRRGRHLHRGLRRFPAGPQRLVLQWRGGRALHADGDRRVRSLRLVHPGADLRRHHLHLYRLPSP